jgi:cell division protein FtsL
MNQNFRTIITAVLFIGSIIVISITLVSVVKEKRRSHAIQDEIIALQNEKKQYEHENGDLMDRIAYLQSEHSYEKEAKTLNYKNPGERVVVIRRSQDELSDVQSSDSTKNDDVAFVPHYRIWFNYFF